MFFACFWLEGFRTSIDHRVDTMFLKKTFKKISKPQMLAICFWLIQIKNSYQNHMKINRYAFTFPNWVWLLSMEIQEIQTSSQGTSSLFLSAKKLSCCFFLRAQTRKCLSIPFLQSSSRKCCWKRLQNEAFQTKPKKWQVQKIDFFDLTSFNFGRDRFVDDFLGNLHPCPPVHRFGRSWPGKCSK